MGRICPLLGPKASAFCMVMSIWGVIFLGLLGVFFHIQAVTLFPDLGFGEGEGGKEGGHSVEEAEGGQAWPSNELVESRYSDKAIQCWIAAGMYGVTLVLVFWQNKYNTQQIF
ncbi:hypothetical protein WR25_19502 [Diploscapter pachys]|uniref:Uncharacterized protein n=1 Tax=Diploscapter pachys TaxID=2018661 RepID=A0A2A2K0Z5_9BILA|nr:hypothetical protein WR25_19502 [Diploscapter pachys]